MFCVAIVVRMVCCCESRLVGTQIFTVVLVAARHNCQCQQIKTKYECKDFFHGVKDTKKYCWVCRKLSGGALVRLGKIKCAAKAGRLVGGFAALFILRRDSQTALPKIALSVGLCLSVNGRTVGF
jgi:hypothetical protein